MSMMSNSTGTELLTHKLKGKKRGDGAWLATATKVCDFFNKKGIGVGSLMMKVN
jgi:hypothetical protein